MDDTLPPGIFCAIIVTWVVIIGGVLFAAAVRNRRETRRRGR